MIGMGILTEKGSNTFKTNYKIPKYTVATAVNVDFSL